MARSISPRNVFASWLVVSLASAAPGEPVEAAPRTITLAEAIAYARAHQPAVRAAMARVAAQSASASVPGAGWLPRFGATAQLYEATANQTTASYLSAGLPDLPRIGGTRATATGSFAPHASTIVGIGLRQELLDFGRIAAQTAAQDALVDVERQRASTATLDVTFDVEEAYFAVLAARATLKASGDAFERARAHRDLAKAGVASGLRSPIELTRAEAELAGLDIGRIRAQGALVAARTVLAVVVGASEPQLDAVENAPSLAELPSLDDALRLNAAHDPRLLEAVQRVTAEEARARAIGAEMRPDVSLTASINGRAGGAPPSGNGIPADGNGWVPNVPNWDVGVVLAWPLFDGVVGARKAAARAEANLRREELEQVRERDVGVVREAYAAATVARATLPGLRRAVDAARANYEQADARFRAGLGTSVELADAESIRTEADMDLVLGEFELARARAALGRAIAEAP